MNKHYVSLVLAILMLASAGCGAEVEDLAESSPALSLEAPSPAPEEILEDEPSLKLNDATVVATDVETATPFSVQTPEEWVSYELSGVTFLAPPDWILATQEWDFATSDPLDSRFLGAIQPTESAVATESDYPAEDFGGRAIRIELIRPTSTAGEPFADREAWLRSPSGGARPTETTFFEEGSLPCARRVSTVDFGQTDTGDLFLRTLVVETEEGVMLIQVTAYFPAMLSFHTAFEIIPYSADFCSLRL
jgi:hypothetical protein